MIVAQLAGTLGAYDAAAELHQAVYRRQALLLLQVASWDYILHVRMYNRMLEYTVVYWNYAVNGQSMFILFRCKQIYNDMRLDYRHVIQ